MKNFISFASLALLLALTSGQVYAQAKSACQEYNVCQASGVCHIAAQRYQCKCPIGRSGKQCETQINACSLEPCKYGCQVAKDHQFDCLPEKKNTTIIVHMDIFHLINDSHSSSNCDSFGLCQNGGRCYTGYRNPRTLIYRCVCPKGYTGLNCQTKHAFGHDSQLIYQALVQIGRSTNGYYYHQNYEYAYLDSFGQRFLLLNTEITSDISVSRIEFHAAKYGRFLVSFIQVPDCDTDTEESCAQKIHQLHKNLNDPALDEQRRYSYSTQLRNMLNSSDSHLITGNHGFNAFNFKEPIAVSKGSILCMTQIDGRLGGILPRATDLPDLVISEEDLSDQLYTSDITGHFTVRGGPTFFSVLLSDTSLVDGSNADNARLAFKASNPVTSLPSGLECVNHLCVNGGICVPLPLIDSYRCSCPVNTLGKYCEIKIGLETSQAEATSTEAVQTTTPGETGDQEVNELD